MPAAPARSCSHREITSLLPLTVPTPSGSLPSPAPCPTKASGLLRSPHAGRPVWTIGAIRNLRLPKARRMSGRTLSRAPTPLAGGLPICSGNSPSRYCKVPEAVPATSAVFNAPGIQHPYTELFQLLRRHLREPLFRPARYGPKPPLDEAAQQLQFPQLHALLHALLDPFREPFLVLPPEHFVIQNVIQNRHLLRLLFYQPAQRP